MMEKIMIVTAFLVLLLLLWRTLRLESKVKELETVLDLNGEALDNIASSLDSHGSTINHILGFAIRRYKEDGGE